MLGADKSYLETNNENGALELRDDCNNTLALSWNTNNPEEMIEFLKEGHDVRPFLIWISNPSSHACVGIRLEEAIAIRNKLDEIIRSATK